MSEVTWPIWTIARIIPGVILVGAMIALFFSVQSQLHIEDVKRYYIDVYENVITSRLTAGRGVFDADELELVNGLAADGKLPYIRGERFRYSIDIGRKCSVADNCREFCYILYKVEGSPDAAVCSFSTQLEGGACSCHKDGWGALPDGSNLVWKGYWSTRGPAVWKDAASDAFPVSIKGKYSDTTLPATLKLVVYDMGA